MSHAVLTKEGTENQSALAKGLGTHFVYKVYCKSNSFTPKQKCYLFDIQNIVELFA